MTTPTPKWREDDVPIAAILVNNETVYEYADGALYAYWTPLTPDQAAEIADMPRVSLVPEALDDYLQNMDPGLRSRTRMHKFTFAGPCPCECNSGGFCGGCDHAGCGGR